MTDEQEKKLYAMPDQKLLIELAIAYGNTEDGDLGSYHRRNILTIFKDLNLDHLVDDPCAPGETGSFYRCPVCGKDVEDVHNARQGQVQCPHCQHVSPVIRFC